MKKVIGIGIITFFLSAAFYGQSINLSADSVAVLLCTKWEVNYAMMGDLKIERNPGASEINYEFNKDKTYFLTTSNPNNKTKGAWHYDEKKKIIKLTLNGRSNSTIISLKEGEFVMLADPKKVVPDDPAEIKIVYKLRTQ